ncbi:pyridoxamine kinase [Scatolibacter rhodanostii]|uniref:pyridoxamine kinase n=1 Tax=Scatolibacter rhodanostii TaxID=2014781 RepID=UPI000C07E284|nr:pyridoxamine kinase [Scatolibacter rhodanostii]
MKQKRVAAIHDISCFGKCSLTVALPIISAAGIEVSAVPTAVLSTHTGGFEGYTYRDLTDDILPIANHWQSLDIHFDSIYTGFLGSFEQINIVSEVFDKFKTKDNLIVVDPVMADNGVLYSLFSEKFPSAMKKLCEKADVIVPNITEACLLLEEPYNAGPYTKEYIEALLRRLAALGPQKVILTGVYFDELQLGAASYDAELDKFDYAFSDRVAGYFHGTGDVFGSALVGAILNGHELADSIRIAVDYTAQSIRRTKEAGTDIRFGVNFEAGLPDYIKQLHLS